MEEDSIHPQTLNGLLEVLIADQDAFEIGQAKHIRMGRQRGGLEDELLWEFEALTHAPRTRRRGLAQAVSVQQSVGHELELDQVWQLFLLTEAQLRLTPRQPPKAGLLQRLHGLASHQQRPGILEEEGAEAPPRLPDKGTEPRSGRKRRSFGSPGTDQLTQPFELMKRLSSRHHERCLLGMP
nr:hypothetical protein [Stigmatella hybrida]